MSSSPKKPYKNHQLYALKRQLADQTEETFLEEIGETGIALKEWKEAVMEDLGGEENISAAKKALIDALDDDVKQLPLLPVHQPCVKITR